MYGRPPDSLSDLISQLCIADNLLKGEEHESRAALVLCDNVVELLLHKQCQNVLKYVPFHKKYELIAERYGGGSTNLKSDFSWDDFQNALGQRFSEKVSFLSKHGHLSSEESQYLNAIHNLRNILYHQGLKWPQVLKALAMAHHKYATEKIAGTEFGVQWWKSNFVTPSVSRSLYLGFNEDSDWQTSFIAYFASSRLDQKELLQTLKSFLIELLVEVDEGLNFLNEVTTDLSPIALIEQGELKVKFPEEQRLQKGILTTPELETHLKAIRHKPVFNSDPRIRLLNRVNALTLSKGLQSCVLKFLRLSEEVELLSSSVRTIVQEADDRINDEIDRMRGK